MNCLKCGKEMSQTLIRRYHYKESGLNHVFLRDSVTSLKCECGQRFVEIRGIERLHDAIAYELLQKKTLLHGQEFRFLRKWVGFTSVNLAQVLGRISRITVSRWENGKSPITGATDHLMRLLVIRVKEQAINQRMFETIKIQEFLEKIKDATLQPAPITINRDKIRNLPFPSSPSSASLVCV